MKNQLKSLLFTLTAIICMQSVQAQVRIERSVEGGDGAFHLKEVQTILTSKDDTVKVMMVLPARLRAKGYENVVLKEDDEILMVNAKRVKTVQDFEKMYNALEIGETVKMGIRRNANLMIESFKKIDPADLPQDQNVMIQTSSSDEGGGHGEGRVVERRIMTGGEDGDMTPWMGTGLMLSTEDHEVKVKRVLEGMTSALSGADIKEGDVITSLNGKKVDSVDNMIDDYRKLEVGAKIEVEYSRGDKKMTMAFKKPETRGRVIMRREN